MRASAAIVLEERFAVDPGGAVYSPNGFDDAIFGRYLAGFESVTVVGRAKRTPSSEIPHRSLSDGRIRFHPVPFYSGPLEFGLRGAAVLAALRAALRGVDVVILRAPGALSMLVQFFRLHQGKPLGVELIGDAEGVFASGVGGRLAPFFSAAMVPSMRAACRSATGVLYVTRRTLQEKYPAAADAVTAYCPDIELPDATTPEKRRPIAVSRERPLALFSAGSMNTMYKGYDVLLRAIGLLKAKGFPVRLRLAGDGRCRALVEQVGRDLRLTGDVVFLGTISRADVLVEMARCDLYLQPSLTEGLPRAVMEAFSTGAPALASAVGGLPELLPPECLIPPGDTAGLAEAIADCIQNPARLERMSEQNIARAGEFSSDAIQARRAEFYQRLAAAVPDHARAASR